MRFLHLADVHLDTVFRSRSPEMARTLQTASRTALQRAVSAAVSECLDAVLIAGDLFDGDRLSIQTERFLGESFSRLAQADIPVIYVTGNHDPAGSAGPGARSGWPDSVALIDSPHPVTVPILRGGDVVGQVTGAGHTSARVTSDLSRAFPRPEGRVPHVALLHTQVSGSRASDAHEPYAPSQLAFLTAAGFDYWALGHVHARQELSESPAVNYPGNLQGRNPRETGARGCLIVELHQKALASVRFIECGPVRWETLHIKDLREGDLPSVARRIEQEWLTLREIDPGENCPDWILRVELDGPSSAYPLLVREEGREELRDALVAHLGILDAEVRCHALRSPERVEDHLGREDVLGEVLRMIAELRRPGGPSPQEILQVVGEDLAGAGQVAPEALDDYMRGLLTHGEATVLSAMLEKEAP